METAARTALLLGLLSFAAGRNDFPAERLHHDLFANYNRHVRPAYNGSETVFVGHGVRLIQLDVQTEVKDEHAMVSLVVWLYSEWTDDRLTWDSARYGGVGSIRLPPGDIWTPDIVLYNSIELPDSRLQEYRVVVSKGGRITWIPMTILTLKCPYYKDDDDYYKCAMKFGSWVYNGYQVNLRKEYNSGIGLEDYVNNPLWEIRNVSGTEEIIKYSCCPEPYVSIKYEFQMKKVGGKSQRRKSGLFSYLTGRDGNVVDDSDMSRVLLLPTVIVSLLVPFQFLVPPESCQRISVLTILLVALVGMFFVMHGADQDLFESSIDLAHFYYVSIVWVFVALLLSIFTLHICRWGHNRSRLPECLRKVFLQCLGNLLCVRHSAGYDVSSASVSKDLVEEKHDVERGSRLEEQMAALLNVVRGLSSYLMELKDNHSEWYRLVLVLDRLHCVVFLVIFIIYACSVLI